MAAHELPIGLQLSKVHKFLVRELDAFSSAEIKQHTGVDIENTTEIYLSLTGDASKVIREKDGKWRWASKYQLTNFNHLITLLARSPDGVCEKDLYDSYKGVREDIKKLKSNKGVHEIKIGSRILLFPRYNHLEIKVSGELTNNYKRVILPEDEIETHRYLVNEGLKNTDDATGIKITQPISRKRPNRKNNRRQKKIKLTNTHLTNSDIDLTKDFNTGKESAFG